MKSRSWWSWRVLSGLFCLICICGCGQSYFFAGRSLPPSGILNRVMVAIQNPSAAASGSLEIEDAYYDVRHNYSDSIPNFFIGGFTGSDPQTIQNMPGEQFGAVYNAGDGSFALISYATEKETAKISTLPYPSSSVFISSDQRYIFATNPQQHVVTIVDQALKANYSLNLPNAYRVSISPGASVALVFVQNSNLVYSVFRLEANQPAPANAEDCEPQNLPVYCLLPVAGNFDRPTKAVFSSDGNTAYILNCGPECGGNESSVSFLPTAGVLIQSGSPVPPGANTQVTATVPIPGGATDALSNGSSLYLAGQQLQPDGFFAGNLTVVNTATAKVVGAFPISDGTHTKMILADDNTLWIGSQLCAKGERFHQDQNGANLQFGCLTMFNTLTNSVVSIESYKGDATGIAAITNLGKVYTAEGGQVYIYSTVDGTALDNTNVEVVGTASDVAYIDAPSDADNDTY